MAHLTVIKGTIDSDAVNVLVRHRGHLRFLDRRNSAPGVEDKDGDVLFASKTVDGGTGEGGVSLVWAKGFRSGRRSERRAKFVASRAREQRENVF